MPRVISGMARSIQLVCPKGRTTRPSADKTKEGIFNVLQARLSFAGLHVLDLFAGSGQLAIEALSRGAARATLVDRSNEARQAQIINLQKTHLTELADIYTTSVAGFLNQAAVRSEKFDLILMDPPYADLATFWQKNVAVLSSILSPGGILAVEGGKETELDKVVTDLQLFKHCHYGSAMVVFYMKNIIST